MAPEPASPALLRSSDPDRDAAWQARVELASVKRTLDKEASDHRP